MFFNVLFPNAVATHKAASVALGIGASIPHLIKNRIRTDYSYLILFSGLPGVLIGAYTATISPAKFSILLLGVLTVFLSIYSFNSKHIGISGSIRPLNSMNIFVGSIGLFIIGFLNGYLSSGTGLFVTIWMISVFNLPFSTSMAYTLIFVGIF